MNRFLQMIMLFGLMEGADPAGGGPTGAAVADPAPVADLTPAADVAATTDPADPASSDPNDPYSLLEAALKTELGDEAPVDPAVDPAAEAAIPEAFQQALTISDFVKTPESMQQAVRAADEVWRVATGEIPARTMLEGFKNSNPQQYEAIISDLKQYLGVSGAQPSPFEALKQSNPDAYTQIANLFQQATGKPLDGQADPRDARLSAVEQEFARQEEARQLAQWNQQVGVAKTKATEFLASKTKGTFAEGNEGYLLAQIGAKAGIPEKQMVDMLLQGKTDKLEAAYKAVIKEETARFKAYSENFLKKQRALKNAVPASKGSAQPVKADTAAMAQLPGESDSAWRTRLWNTGIV